MVAQGYKEYTQFRGEELNLQPPTARRACQAPSHPSFLWPVGRLEAEEISVVDGFLLRRWEFFFFVGRPSRSAQEIYELNQ